MITNAQLAAQQAALIAQFVANLIDEIELTAGLEALYNRALISTSVGGMTKQLTEVLNRFDQKWSAYEQLTIKGVLDLVSELPATGVDGDLWWVAEATVDFPYGQAYVWISSIWVPQGDDLIKGQTGAGVILGGAEGQVLSKASADDLDLIWIDPPAGGVVNWGDVGGALSNQTDLVSALAGKQAVDDDLTAIAGLTPANDDIIQRKAGAWTNRTPVQLKTDLGLSNVDNTSDANKPVSTATQTALDLKMPLSYLDTDVALAANSDTKVASQKATKAYVDALIAANDAMVFKGVVDCSANPNYPAADRGHTYRVSVAGKIGGASGPNVQAGDILLCITDGTASGDHATVGANWGIVQVNIDGALTTADINSVVQAYSANLAAVAAGTYAGDDSIVTVGTITAGAWNGTAIGATYGGTGQTTYAVGDILYASTTTALSKLTAGTAGYVLTSNGPGVAPSWQASSGGGGSFTGGTLTSALGIIAGSASAPGLFISGDTDTGLWSPGADQLAASVGGAEILRLAAGQMTVTGGTTTTAKAALLATTTWNNSAVVHEAAKVNVTNTASATGSRLLALQVGGADKFLVDKTGDVLIAGSGFRVGRGLSQISTNVVLGHQALNKTTATGGSSVFVGATAGYNCESTTGGNVVVGRDALRGQGANAAATGTLTFGAGNVSDGDTVTVNGKTYTFQATLTNVDGNVLVGASNTASATNLKNAINASGGTPGVDYAAATTAHTTVSASVSTNVVTVTALTTGTGGNAYGFTTTAANITLAPNTGTLSGGTVPCTASYSVALGYGASYYNQSGTQNMAIGPFALQDNTTGSGNCAVGYSTAINNLGNNNTAIGSFALQRGLAAGEHNIGIGYWSGKGVAGVTDGVQNVFIGRQAGEAFTTGDNNTCIGAYAGDLITTGSGNICIGYNTDPPAATDSSKLNIGGLIKGDMAGAVITAVGDVRPEADGTRNLGSGSLRWNTVYATSGSINTSDERWKAIREGGALTPTELAAWGRVRAMVYRDGAAFAAKGEAARLHVGYGWDAIRQAFAAEGLDASRYGLWCSDPVMEPRTRIEIVQRPVLDAEGREVVEMRPAVHPDGTPAMVEERRFVTEMVPTETPVMESFIETYLEIEEVNGERVAVARTREAERPAIDHIPVLLEDGTPATAADGSPLTAAVPRTRIVETPVEREEVTLVPRMAEFVIYEDVENEVVEMVPTGEVRGALRYSECAVFEAAWLRAELAALQARVAVLEAA